MALYDRCTARVKMNVDLSDYFVLERGRRQSSQISPLLFALFIKPLGQLIMKSEAVKGINATAIEQKVALFADDNLVYLEELVK